MSDKEFRSIQEQLNILKTRGLYVPDEIYAQDFLLRNNYYRVSGYSLTLRSHDVFSKTAQFQNIVDIYNFDHELRHVLLKFIEIIEVTVKSVFAYEFTRVYGPTGYLDDSYFTDKEKHAEILSKAKTQMQTRLPHEAYLKHFINDLHQDIPFWAFVDLLTISDISFLYKISPMPVKKAVADAMGLRVKGDLLLGIFMHSMTIIRNLCAHGSRLFNRLFEQKPNLNKRERLLLIRNPDGQLDNSHLFGFVIIMNRLLKREDFLELKQEISCLTKKYPFVDMKYYGFPPDWEKTV